MWKHGPTTWGGGHSIKNNRRRLTDEANLGYEISTSFIPLQNKNIPIQKEMTKDV